MFTVVISHIFNKNHKFIGILSKWRSGLSELHTNSNYEMMDDQQKLNFLSDFFEDFTQMEDKTYYALKVKQTAEKHSTLSDLEIQTLKNVILDCGISQFSLL